MLPFSVLLQHCGPFAPINIFQCIIKANRAHVLLHTVN